MKNIILIISLFILSNTVYSQAKIYYFEAISPCKCLLPDAVITLIDSNKTKCEINHITFEVLLKWDSASKQRYKNSFIKVKDTISNWKDERIYYTFTEHTYFNWDMFKPGEPVLKKGDLLIHKNYIFKIWKN